MKKAGSDINTARKILLADDGPGISSLLKYVLESEGYVVNTNDTDLYGT